MKPSVVVVALLGVCASSPRPADSVERQLSATFPQPVAAELTRHLAEVAIAPGMAAQLERLVAANLDEKRRLGVVLDAAQVRRQVIDYEAFKLTTFIDTGVFPKRYFGFFDERGDTAAYETRLKAAVRSATAVCNRWLVAEHSELQVTEREIAITFLAEGGAMFLTTRQADLEQIDPVKGIGLDDFSTGFDQLGPLVRRLDEALGTRLQSRGQRAFTFEEAIAGTAAMWVWEKRIAQTKLRDAKRPALEGRSLDEQYVIGSLVYNSGVLFDQSTIDGIVSLQLGSYLADLSEKSKQKRTPLAVFTPAQSRRQIIETGAYPAQPTNWSGAYHVLQRYGAAVAVSRFSDAFDAGGAFRVTGVAGPATPH